MYMTPGEICKEYDEARSKKGKIAILADLNSCEKEDIMKILITNGYQLPTAKPRRDTAKPKEEEVEEITPKEEKAENRAQAKPQGIPSAVEEALIARLEEIDAQIAKLEKEYREIADFMGSSTAREVICNERR